MSFFNNETRVVFIVPSILLVVFLLTYLDVRGWFFIDQLWTLLDDWMQFNWEGVLDRIGRDEFSIYVYWMSGWTIGLYWFVGLLYTFVDLFNWPAFIVRHKVQAGVNQPVPPKRLASVLGTVIFNQFVVSIPFALVGFYVLKWQGGKPPIELLPSFRRVVRDLVAFIVSQEIIAYYFHRWSHHRLVYKWMHKQHHEWTAPVALTAVYNHPLDHIVNNLLPTTIGVGLMNSHVFTTWLWVTWATVRTLSDHSGYHLLVFPSPRRHDFHHAKFTECFGVWGVLDYLHGTEKHFRASLVTADNNNVTTLTNIKNNNMKRRSISPSATLKPKKS